MSKFLFLFVIQHIKGNDINTNHHAGQARLVKQGPACGFKSPETFCFTKPAHLGRGKWGGVGAWESQSHHRARRDGVQYCKCCVDTPLTNDGHKGERPAAILHGGQLRGDVTGVVRPNYHR